MKRMLLNPQAPPRRNPTRPSRTRVRARTQISPTLRVVIPVIRAAALSRSPTFPATKPASTAILHNSRPPTQPCATSAIRVIWRVQARRSRVFRACAVFASHLTTRSTPESALTARVATRPRVAVSRSPSPRASTRTRNATVATRPVNPHRTFHPAALATASAATRALPRMHAPSVSASAMRHTARANA